MRRIGALCKLVFNKAAASTSSFDNMHAEQATKLHQNLKHTKEPMASPLCLHHERVCCRTAANLTGVASVLSASYLDPVATRTQQTALRV